MPKVVARIKIKGKHFETEVDLDEALKVRAGKGDITRALEFPRIFTDMQKGNVAKEAPIKIPK